MLTYFNNTIAMKKIAVFTNDKEIQDLITSIPSFRFTINSYTADTDLYILDSNTFQDSFNNMHPSIVLVSPEYNNITFDCEYIIQKPFDTSTLLNAINLFILSDYSSLTLPYADIKKITSLFDEICIDKKRKGYQYLLECTLLYIQASGKCLYKNIFASVASNHSTTSAAVERSIRTAIEHTWRYGNITQIDKLFGNSIDPEKGKPSNAEFISMIAEQFKLL